MNVQIHEIMPFINFALILWLLYLVTKHMRRKP
jgi:hypothetical protein